jgi:hypothetical protein
MDTHSRGQHTDGKMVKENSQAQTIFTRLGKEYLWALQEGEKGNTKYVGYAG